MNKFDKCKIFLLGIKNTCIFKLKRKNIYKLKKFKNIHSGERCFIIGNGPSLNIKDLELINNEYTFAANRIYKIFDETKFRPTYYFAQDQTIISTCINDIKNINSIKFLRFINKKNLYDENAIEFLINNTNYLLNKEPKFSSNANQVIYDGFTVTYSMIQFAIYMGFEKIYLIGVDFNYDLKNGSISSKSYFNKKLFDKNKIGAPPEIEYNLLAYNKAKKEILFRTSEIYNATRGGKLEVFERVNFDEIFKKK